MSSKAALLWPHKKGPKKVRIVEVGPRDGLQNEKAIIPTKEKVKFIKGLAKAGLKEIEVASFVKVPKIPQMADSPTLLSQLQTDPELNGIKLITLVPNIQGMKSALNAGAQHIAVFTGVSNTFNLANINATTVESLKRISEVMKIANSENIPARGYVSTAFGCPFEGKINIKTLRNVMLQLQDMGVHEIALGDTIGIANPKQVCQWIDFLSKDFSLDFLTMHFHDSYGRGLVNILASLQMGVTNFDSSAAGLGGCPYALGASGNVATEDVYGLLSSLSIETGIDPYKLTSASKQILLSLGHQGHSKFLTAFLARS